MKRTPTLGSRLTVAMCTLAVAAAATAAPLRSTAPAPRLRFVGTELYSANAKDWVRYKYDVTNKSRYSDALFAASPDLPPCGLNSNAARTWVDFYDSAANASMASARSSNRPISASCGFRSKRAWRLLRRSTSS